MYTFASSIVIVSANVFVARGDLRVIGHLHGCFIIAIQGSWDLYAKISAKHVDS
jgi:hypothetical protein